MEWSLAIAAAAVLAVGSVSDRLRGTVVTPAMAFAAIGLLVGPKVLDGVDLEASSPSVRIPAEVALSLVLFSDASRIDLRRLRPDVGVPIRLLGVGLPLTIALGTVAAALTFTDLSLPEAAILAVLLAPTDAALGQAVVTDRRVPARIREGLNVESGLNDGICVPLLFAAVAAADVQSSISDGRNAVTLLGEEIGCGLLAGVASGVLLAWAFRAAGPRGLIAGHWKQILPVAGIALAYGAADALGGSGFIAAFVAGVSFRAALGRDPEDLNRLTEEVGDALSGITFLLFGAVLLEPALDQVSWRIVLYAALSLTVVRMLPVAVAMVGSGARSRTVGFMGWFGPRGLASIVFAAIVVQESNLPHQETILLAAYVTVGLSVLAHGLTAVPFAGSYGRWMAAHPRDHRPAMETLEVEPTRARGESPERA